MTENIEPAEGPVRARPPEPVDEPGIIVPAIMPTPEWRGAKFTASGRIDCEILHPRYGWLPFRVDAEDTGAEFAVAELYEAIRASGQVEPYEPPSDQDLLAAERATMRCSRFQARAALHAAGLLRQVEAAVAVADPMVQIAWADATEFNRNSPTIAALQVAIALTDERVDDLFRSAMQITA